MFGLKTRFFQKLPPNGIDYFFVLLAGIVTD
jgi:hypothetical protein